jgi:hypothetical protein
VVCHVLAGDAKTVPSILFIVPSHRRRVSTLCTPTNP